MGERVGKWLYNCSMAVGIFLFGILLFGAFMCLQTEFSMNSKIFSFLETGFLGALFVALYWVINKVEDKYLKKICLIMTIVIFLIQIIFIFLLQAQLRADSLQVYAEAVNMLHTGGVCSILHI